MTGKELEFVEWLTKRGLPAPGVEVGIGDDMAVLATSAGKVLVSSDMLLDGVHFDTTSDDLMLIGRKAIACSLSDCAAMAVRPVAVTVSVAWPRGLDQAGARLIFEGMASIAEDYDIAIAGGDTTSWDKPLAIDVAITAVPYDGIEPVLRSGATEGDTLYVTGRLGGSRLGRHLTFTPRVREARLAAERFGRRLHAMIDLSDGLSLDLSRVCKSSGVGAVIDEERFAAVVSEDARRLAAIDGRSAEDHALSDGEDFELLIAVDGEADVLGVELFPVGVITGQGLHIARGDGRLELLEPRGYVH